jgi:hypothetical protein
MKADSNPNKSPLMLIPLGPGEVLDRLTILVLKAKAALTDHQQSTILLEQELMSNEWIRSVNSPPSTAAEWDELLTINSQLWLLEDEVRAAERQEDFGPQFIAAARSIYRTNDRRSQIKRAINERLGSTLYDIKFHNEN